MKAPLSWSHQTLITFQNPVSKHLHNWKLKLQLNELGLGVGEGHKHLVHNISFKYSKANKTHSIRGSVHRLESLVGQPDRSYPPWLKMFYHFKITTHTHTHVHTLALEILSNVYVGVHPVLGRETQKIMYRVMTSSLDWREEKNQGTAGGEMSLLGVQEVLKSVINFIHADSRGNWEPLPTSQEGKCYDSNYGNERWFLWLDVESTQVGKAYRKKRQVEPITRQYS